MQNPPFLSDKRFAYYIPAFLPRKEAAELIVPNFAIGGVNSDHNTEYMLNELLLALKYPERLQSRSK